jgi:hypothetical protein
VIRRSLQSSRIVVLGCWLVALLVFCWGSESKASLYHFDGTSPTVPLAKLLSEQERPNAVSVSSAAAPDLQKTQPQATPPLLRQLPILVAHCAVFDGLQQLWNGHAPVTRHAALSYFSLLPPPAL